MGSKFHLIGCSQKTVLYVLKVLLLLSFPKFYHACHLDANGIKQGSDSKLTDIHAGEYRKIAFLGTNYSVCDE